MKKFKLFGLIAVAALAFVSCDLLDELEEASDEMNKSEEAKFTESQDGLEISVTYKESGIGIAHIAKFKAESGDTLCTSLVSKTTFPLELAAKETYEEMIKDMEEKDKANVKRDGKEITVDHPENVGEKKAVIKLAFMAIYQGYKKGGEIVSNIDIPTEDGGEGGDGGDGDGDGGSGSSALISYEEFLDDSEDLRIAASYSNPPLGQSIIASFIIEPASSDTICSDYSIIDFYSTEAEAEAVYNRLTEGMSDLEKIENGYLLQRNAVHSKNVNMESWSIMQIRSTLKGKVQMWELGIFN